MGTIDNIFVLHGLIRHFINEGKRLYPAFIDFTKAFDYVVRESLWLKLIKSGVRGKILNVIKSMYTSVKSMVKCIIIVLVKSFLVSWVLDRVNAFHPFYSLYI